MIYLGMNAVFKNVLLRSDGWQNRSRRGPQLNGSVASKLQ